MLERFSHGLSRVVPPTDVVEARCRHHYGSQFLREPSRTIRNHSRFGHRRWLASRVGARGVAS